MKIFQTQWASAPKKGVFIKKKCVLPSWYLFQSWVNFSCLGHSKFILDLNKSLPDCRADVIRRSPMSLRGRRWWGEGEGRERGGGGERGEKERERTGGRREEVRMMMMMLMTEVCWIVHLRFQVIERKVSSKLYFLSFWLCNLVVISLNLLFQTFFKTDLTSQNQRENKWTRVAKWIIKFNFPYNLAHRSFLFCIKIANNQKQKQKSAVVN